MSRLFPRQISARRVVLTSFLVDLSDIALSLTAALLSGSVVMTTQTLQGLADLTASGFTVLGVRRSHRAPDAKHPFGYGRELYFWTLIAGLIMFTLTAGLSFYLGLNRFLHPQPISHIAFTYSVLIFGIFTNGYSLTQSSKRLIHRHQTFDLIRLFLNSPLVETKVALTLDLYGTLASIIGLIALALAPLTGHPEFDGLGAMLIAMLLAYLAFLLLISVKDLVVGKSASPQIQDQITQAVLTVPEVTKVLDLKTTIIGEDKLLVNLEVHLKHGLKTQQIERLVDQIKHVAKTEVPVISHIQVELETPDTGHQP